MFWRKNRNSYIPKKAFEGIPKYRFTFVPEGWSYYEGFTVQISEKIKNKNNAFYCASEVFRREHEDKAKGSVAVFYGDVESGDCSDTLYGAYHSFYKRNKR